MSSNQYPSDVQFAGLIKAATAAADAQARNSSILGKRSRDEDDSLIDTQLRDQTAEVDQHTGQLPTFTPILHNSATVLFREPSEASKKYSRPPLGKVYTDLALPPESFLRLQNAAKAFMLDENHWERRDVVGHKRHSNNNDVAKLRLWSCVEEFLNQDNNGEKWFGHDAGGDVSEDAPARTFFWPEHRQKITKLCMPLFRKMVTNERQRVYAFETRKQDASKADKIKKGSANVAQEDGNAASPTMPANGTATIDQNLDTANVTQQTYASNSNLSPISEQLSLHISIVSNDNGSYRRVVPRFTVSSDAVPTLSALAAEAHKHCDLVQVNTVSSEDEWFAPVVRVWLPDGLVRVKDDGQWMVALLSGGLVEWMDSQVRVLIEVEANPETLTV